jgi:hypothetical protein
MPKKKPKREGYLFSPLPFGYDAWMADRRPEFCEHCDARIRRGTTVCSYCGAELRKLRNWRRRVAAIGCMWLLFGLFVSLGAIDSA